LRNDFARLSKWLDRGETIEIIKRGKHVADLLPKTGGERKGLLGCTPSPYPIPADIGDPVDVQWEAMKRGICSTPRSG
jgi:antitoxin (DNA-binding transcriptional repressor) of toxin-antitoxin stability system